MKKIISNTRLLLLISLVLSIGLETSCTPDVSLNLGSKVELISFGPTGSQIGDTISFIGKNLDKIVKINFVGDSVLKTSFITQTAQLLKIKVPDYTERGFVTLYTNKDTIVSKTMFDLLVPVTITSITASVRPGDDITITGEHVNWINEVWFSKDLVVRDSNFVSKSLTQIVVKVPKTAQSGPLLINTAGTKPLSITPDQDLNVILPAITSFDPIPVDRGGNLTITGTDLDLAKGVIFHGVKDTVKSFISQTRTQLIVPVPLTAAKGQITLVSYSNLPIVSTANVKFVGDLEDLAYAFYDDALMTGWSENGYNRTADYANTELVRDGVYSLKATFTKANGYLDFYNVTGISPTGYTELAFSVYGGSGTDGKNISVKVNSKSPGYNATIQEGKWVEFKIPLATLGVTATIKDVRLTSASTGVVYFDHVGLR